MVVKRRISRNKYVLAGVLTALIFLLGISLGMILDNERFRWIEELNKEYELDFKRLQFQSLYLDSVKKTDESCLALHTTLEEAIADLGYSLERFLEYEKQSKMSVRDFDIVKRRYLLDNLRYWLFTRELKETCNLDVVTILYFYSEDYCKNCPDQGVILTYFKKKFGDQLLVFPINLDLENDEKSVINLLRRRYDVYSTPTLVIEDEKYEGVINKLDLNDLICEGFKLPKQGCADT